MLKVEAHTSYNGGRWWHVWEPDDEVPFMVARRPRDYYGNVRWVWECSCRKRACEHRKAAKADWEAQQ